MAINHYTPFANTPYADGLFYPKTTVTTVATATAVTLTAAEVLGGIVLQDPAGGSVTTTLPTAALMVAAMNGARIGTTVRFLIRNTADSSETITVAAGTGGTTSGTMTIAQSNTKEFLLRLTGVTEGSEAYYVYSIGTLTT